MSQLAEIRHLHLVEGVAKKQIARRLQLDIKTVRRAVEQPTPPVRVELTRYGGDITLWGGGVNDARRHVPRIRWSEPYRVCRRAFSLRGWSHVTTESVFPRSTRASGAAGPRAWG